jgi:hypothetical protein
MPIIKPYPIKWHRRLDFLPPLGLQIAVGEERLELYYSCLTVTIQEEKRPSRDIRTEFGTLKTRPALMNRVEYEMGMSNPRNGINPIPQREILGDIWGHLGDAVRIVGEMPDIVIRSRGVVERVPKEVEDLPVFQGTEYIFYHQNGYGNFPHRWRRALAIRAISNPYRFMKADLLRYRIINRPNDPIFKKLRSTLKTEWLITEALGWSDIGDSGILSLEQALTQTRWWTDIARPARIQVNGIQGQIYRLLRRNRLVVV